MSNARLTVVVLTLVTACGTHDRPAANSSGRAAPMIPAMRAELDSMASAPEMLRQHMDGYRGQTHRLVDAMNIDLTRAGMHSDPAYEALADSVLRDVEQLPTASAAEFPALSEAHLDRVRRLMAVYERMVTQPSARGAGRSADTTAARIASTAGFSAPESAIYDADQDVFFVTNMNGNPGAKDGNGFISRLRADGAIDSLKFIAGGRGRATLNAPKGTALVGDTLWVADIDALRGFNKRTGAPVATIEFGRRARFLNDLAAGPDKTLYITDTGIQIDAKGNMTHPGPDRIFSVGPDRKTRVAAEGAILASPNGITWDAAKHRFIVVSFGGTSLLAWQPGSAPTAIGTGPGGHDGVEVLADGRALISSWADSTVFIFANGQSSTVITGVSSPADIGLDARRNRVAIPQLMGDRVQLWQLPAPQ